MNIKLNKDDIELLIQSKCSWFYETEPDRFEHQKGNTKLTNKEGTANFVEGDLNALFVFNYFKEKKLNPVMFWDTSLNVWMIYSKEKF